MHIAPLSPTDRFFAATFGRLIPRYVHPNHLTLLRLVLIPFVLQALWAGWYGVGVWMFAFAALTDWFDGALARTRRQVTPWGITYDPVVDKLLIGSVLFFFLPPYIGLDICLALLVVETSLLLGAWWRARDGKLRPAGPWGKAKMVTEAIGISLGLLGVATGTVLLIALARGTLVLAIILAIASVAAGLRRFPTL